MTDVYIEGPDEYEEHLSTVQRMRAEVSRAAHKLERALHDRRPSTVADFVHQSSPAGAAPITLWQTTTQEDAVGSACAREPAAPLPRAD